MLNSKLCAFPPKFFFVVSARGSVLGVTAGVEHVFFVRSVVCMSLTQSRGGAGEISLLFLSFYGKARHVGAPSLPLLSLPGFPLKEIIWAFVSARQQEK